jgi:methylmalonyl-CoA mutase N-terminal domain/subunit
MQIDSFAPRFSFFFAANINLLEEVAKFRALRRVWAKTIRERFGSSNPQSMMLRFHVQTDGFTLTAQQPLNNIVRVTIQALAGGLGGCQSMHANSFDEALGLPTEQSVQLSLRTQQIIAEESGIADTVDPLGGSYYLESLTNQIEEDIWKYIQKIDGLGGSLEAIRQGYIQREISRSAFNYQRAIDKGEQILVGVNKYAVKEKESRIAFEINSNTEKKQIERLNKLKRERNNPQVKQALNEVQRIALSNNNLMPVLIEAVKAYATIGEISDTLREVFGEYREPEIF